MWCIDSPSIAGGRAFMNTQTANRAKLKKPRAIEAARAILFTACMVCHGELVRLKPPVHRLTAFYLTMSLGGALGGVFVAIVAPVVFTTFA
jgi:hypothetical protein